MNELLLRDITEVDLNRERSYDENLLKCTMQNKCPTCQNQITHDIYLEEPDSVLYEDDFFRVVLEYRPRKSGHTVIIVKRHYEDISDMPVELAQPLFTVMHKVILALKMVLKAEKVYVLTMCDNGKNHLTFQLLPRYKGEPAGSKVFTSPRHRLKTNSKVISALRMYIKQL